MAKGSKKQSKTESTLPIPEDDVLERALFALTFSHQFISGANVSVQDAPKVLACLDILERVAASVSAKLKKDDVSEQK